MIFLEESHADIKDYWHPHEGGKHEDSYNNVNTVDLHNSKLNIKKLHESPWNVGSLWKPCKLIGKWELWKSHIPCKNRRIKL